MSKEFTDTAKICVTGGRGGDGCMSFLREKYRPKGGPDGGDGGRGGSVWLEAGNRIDSLWSFLDKIHFTGQPGLPGKGKNMEGRNAEDLTVDMPCGTLIYDLHTGRLLADLANPGDRFLAAKGGLGGRGNASFKGADNRLPKFRELGEAGQSRWLRLELRLIADVGIVGFPNAGKSSLLSLLSAARPKVANYPFTTLSPNLGAVKKSEFQDFSLVFADIPGLIEGAAQGKGLGNQFLNHIQRVRLLLIVLDLEALDPAAPLYQYDALMKEMGDFDGEILNKPQVVVANKLDLPEAEEKFAILKKEFKTKRRNLMGISCRENRGIAELLEAIKEKLSEIPQEIRRFTPDPEPVTPPWVVERDKDGFVLKGWKIDRMVKMTEFSSPYAVEHLQERLYGLGVEDQLKKMGVKEGDTVKIGEYEFNYQGGLES